MSPVGANVTGGRAVGSGGVAISGESNLLVRIHFAGALRGQQIVLLCRGGCRGVNGSLGTKGSLEVCTGCRGGGAIDSQ